MTSRRSQHGVVAIAALDVRRRPSHRSELRSQLLLGEAVRSLGVSPDQRWWRIENLADGYHGWVRRWGLVETSARGRADWLRRATARVRVSFAEARTDPGRGDLVTPLFWNSRLVSGRSLRGFRRVELPDGRRAWVRSRVLGSGRRLRLAARVRSLLGTPYLWGGRTPMGIDCSAFTQQVLAEQGVPLPRDAAQQFRSSRPLDEEEAPKPGDLLFFGPSGGRLDHVALALGGGYFAHSRGRVRINSMDHRNQLWDKWLSSQFRGYRRPASGPGSPGRRGRGGREPA